MDVGNMYVVRTKGGRKIEMEDVRPVEKVTFKSFEIEKAVQYKPDPLDELDFDDDIYGSLEGDSSRSDSTLSRAESVQGARPAEVEICECERGYSGFHCQYCATGFTRENAGDIGSRCIPCTCNDRSDSCDGETGVCRSCRGNYIGDHCEQCPDRFFAKYIPKFNNFTCEECLCPSEDYQDPRASKDYCEVLPDMLDYKCNYCLEGYKGRHCDICETGYYGEPINGIPCMRCGCDTDGSVHENCDDRGNCLCKDGYAGKKCSDCKDKHVKSFTTDNICLSCDNYCLNTLFERIKPLAKSQEK